MIWFDKIKDDILITLTIILDCRFKKYRFNNTDKYNRGVFQLQNKLSSIQTEQLDITSQPSCSLAPLYSNSATWK
jgi:hypothetical protein